MTADMTQREYFEDLLDRGKDNVDRGDLTCATDIYGEAIRWAQEHGETVDVDRASCCRLAILVNSGEAEIAVRSLRMILMRSSSPVNQFMAAYNVSCYYETEEDFAKSRFYADLAIDHARRTETGYYVALGYSQLGNLLIRDSRFPEALEQFDQSLELFDGTEEYKRLAVLASMGFCHLACGDFGRGFEKLFTVRRRYRQLGLGPSIAVSRLRLAFSFGHLELERFHQSVVHGREALRIGEVCGDLDVVKKSLYLLGEAEKLRGDEMKAFTYFAHLQEDFYPENPHLPEILLYSDTNKLVNVWA